MSRRGKGEGSIYKTKDGRHRGFIDLGFEDGKRKRKYFSAAKRSEVAKQIHDALEDQKKGMLIDAPNLTLKVYLERAASRGSDSTISVTPKPRSCSS